MKGILKSRLPVIWTSNRKAWVMQQIFSEWYAKHFCHSVLTVLQSKQSALKGSSVA